MGRYFRSVITVEVLSSDEPIEDYTDLATIAYAITEGSCSGVYRVTETAELTAPEMAAALEAQGSDPSFLLSEDDLEALA